MTRPWRWIGAKAIMSGLPLTLVTYAILLDRPAPVDDQSAPSLELTASLVDTLPTETVAALHADVKHGVRFSTGQSDFFLFEYEADHDVVLNEIAGLPASIYYNYTDMQCLQAGTKEVMTRNQSYLVDCPKEAVAFGFPGVPDEYVAFTCRKPPYEHTLLLHTRSKKVIHGIAQVL